jgi:carbamoyl-phosphate synthase large subunit
MLSTGEVMGIDDDFGIAFAKSQMAAGNALPTSGNVLFSVRDVDKKKAVELARQMVNMGFRIVATKGTCLEFINGNIPSEFVLKMSEGRPNVVDWIINGKIDLIINATTGAQSVGDSFPIRRTALDKQIPYVTTIRAAAAVVKAIKAMKDRKIGVKPLQRYYD